MTVRSVMRVIFTCLLLLCASLPGCTKKQPGFSPPDPNDPAYVKRGNCGESFGGSGANAYDYCFYTFGNPATTVATSCCKSNPPSGVCSTATPQPACPP